jgi:hypothetical protein
MVDTPQVMDPLEFDAMAEGVFSAASSAEEARTGLISAYNTYQWSDDAAVKKSLEGYATDAGHLYRDQTIFSDIGQNAPVSFQEVIASNTIKEKDPTTGAETDKVNISGDLDLYTKWEEANLAAIKDSSDPAILINKQGYEESIKQFASQKRQETYKKSHEGLGLAAQFGYNLAEQGANAALAVARPAAPVINWLANKTVTNNFDLNRFSTEVIDPEFAQSWTGNIEAGIAQGAATALVTATTGPAGFVAYQGPGALGEVVNRYTETKRLTGSREDAKTAATLEAGSQAVQLVGEKLAFGAAGKVLKHGLSATAGKELVRGMAGEFVSEGSGQLISGKAQGIQEGNPDKPADWESAFKAGAIGAISAGVVGGVAYGDAKLSGRKDNRVVIPGKQDSAQRADEVDEFGVPITPVIKQNIGPVSVKPADTKVEPITEVVTTPEGDVRVVTKPDVENLTPLYEMEDGSVDARNASGQIVRTLSNGTVEGAFDNNIYVDESTAAKIVNETASGRAHLVNGNAGDENAYLISTDGSGKLEKIPSSPAPAVGMYRVGVSNAVSPNKQEITTQIHPIPARIRKINIDRSIGAAGSVEVEQKLSSFGTRLHNTLTERPEMLSPTLQGLASKGLYYDTLSHDEANAELRQYGSFFGLADWLMSTPSTTTSGIESRAGVVLLNQFANLENEAIASGDGAAIEQLATIAKPLFEHIAQKEAVAGQATYYTRGKDLVGGLARITAYETAKTEAVYEEATAEKIHVDEIRNPELITAKIEAEKKALVDAEVARDGPDAQDQQTYEEEVAAIEAEGVRMAEAFNAAMDTEITKVTELVQAQEKKVTREKRKAIEKVEKETGKLYEKLLNVTANAQETKDLTSEEIKKIEKDATARLDIAVDAAKKEVDAIVKNERKTKEQAKQSELAILRNRAATARAAADKVKKEAAIAVANLKIKRSTTDESKQLATDARIDKHMQHSLAIQSRAVAAEAAVQQAEAVPAIAAHVEEILTQLEEGIVVSQVPVKGKRVITVKTKSGLELSKLFSKSEGGALDALLGLNKVVNNLAKAVSLGGKVKESSNALIQFVEKQINDNKALVAKAQGVRPGTAAERKAIDANKKLLQDLVKRPAATKDSVLDPKTKVKLEKYKSSIKALKEKRDSRPPLPDRTERQKKIAELEHKKAKAEAANKRVKDKAIAAAKVEAENQAAITKLRTAIDSMVEGGQRRKLQSTLDLKLAGSKGTSIPMKRLIEAVWITGLIGNATNLVTAGANFGLIIPGKAVSLGLMDAYYFVKKFGTGIDYRSTLTPFLAEIFNKYNLSKTKGLANAVLQGNRVGIPFEDSEIAIQTGLIHSSLDTTDLMNDLQTIREMDLLKLIGELTYEDVSKNKTFKSKMGAAGRNAFLALHKTPITWVSGMLTRMISVIEAINSVPLTAAFHGAAAAYYYNKTVDAAKIKNELLGPDGKMLPTTALALQEFIYDSKANRIKAEAAAKTQADRLREAGVKYTKHQQRVLEEEIFQSLPSRMHHGRDAIKQVGQINLNTPAQGAMGVVVEIIKNGVRILEGAGQPFATGKFLVAFANSVGQMAGQQLEFTPFGAAVKFQTKKSLNRTPFERDLALASSIVGTTIGGALIAALRTEREKPEDERVFDIIGPDYHTDPDARKAYKDSGGLTSSIRIGDTYIPFPETVYGLMLGIIGSYGDRLRSAKEPDAGLTGALIWSSITDAGYSLSRVSMVRGLADLYDNIQKAHLRPEKSKEAIGRILLNLVKPAVIPGIGAMRTVSKYMDNPVDAWRDVKSAIVEGIPFVQSAVGKSALNIFGEDLDARDLSNGMHRVYSTRAQDLDIRWLVDRNYSIPSIDDIKLDSKKEKAIAGATLTELEYPAKRAILKDAGPGIRNIVAQFRNAEGYSARSDKTQTKLRTYVNKLLSASTVKYLAGQLKED